MLENVCYNQKLDLVEFTMNKVLLTRVDCMFNNLIKAFRIVEKL